MWILGKLCQASLMFVGKAISLHYSNRLRPYPQALDQAGRASQLIVLSVIVLKVIMLSVVAPKKGARLRQTL